MFNTRRLVSSNLANIFEKYWLLEWSTGREQKNLITDIWEFFKILAMWE